MDIGKVKFIRPQSPLLQKYIKGYYMHCSDDPDFSKTVFFYQNITSTINIYQDTQVNIQEKIWEYHHSPNTGFNARMVVKIKGCQGVKLSGKFNKMAIVFYPLGINHFISDPLSELVTSIYSPFTHYDTHLSGLLPTLFTTDLVEQKRALLDQFFLARFRPFTDERLHKAVQKIIHHQENIKVADLANELNISRRTLLRLFKKHLTYSIEEYIAIVKFRRALLNFQQQGLSNLTNIAFDSAYYDQADFNHHLKNRSGLTPGELFSQLNIIDDVLFWNLK